VASQRKTLASCPDSTYCTVTQLHTPLCTPFNDLITISSPRNDAPCERRCFRAVRSKQSESTDSTGWEDSLLGYSLLGTSAAAAWVVFFYIARIEVVVRLRRGSSSAAPGGFKDRARDATDKKPQARSDAPVWLSLVYVTTRLCRRSNASRSACPYSIEYALSSALSVEA